MMALEQQRSPSVASLQSVASVDSVLVGAMAGAMGSGGKEEVSWQRREDREPGPLFGGLRMQLPEWERLMRDAQMIDREWRTFNPRNRVALGVHMRGTDKGSGRVRVDAPATAGVRRGARGLMSSPSPPRMSATRRSRSAPEELLGSSSLRPRAGR